MKMPSSTTPTICESCNARIFVDSAKSIKHSVIGGIGVLFVFVAFALLFDINQSSSPLVKTGFVSVFLVVIFVFYNMYRKNWLVVEE